MYSGVTVSSLNNFGVAILAVLRYNIFNDKNKAVNNLRKLKIYLDSSVISHMDVTDRTYWMADTRRLWEEMVNGKYEIFISVVAFDEIGRCAEEKLKILMGHLKNINYTVSENSKEIERIANQIIQLGILKQKSFDDCLHIAHAVTCGCDYIVSWNFKHMVNVKTIKGVRAITNLGDYNNIDIVAPSMLLESED